MPDLLWLAYIPWLGVAINLGGSYPYLRDTLSGRTQPNRVSFALWGILPLIAATAAVSDGAFGAALPIFAEGLAPLLILAASFRNKRSLWKTRPFDYLCGALSLLAVALWQATGSPEVAIGFAILADILASAPTFRKAWTHPQTETVSAYIFAVIAAMTALCSPDATGFSGIAFPLYLIVEDGLLVLILLQRGRLLNACARGPHESKERAAACQAPADAP